MPRAAGDRAEPFQHAGSEPGHQPGAGGTQRLPRLIGLEAALDMLLSGRSIDAQTAMQWGLIDATCPPEDLIRPPVDLVSDRESPFACAPRPVRTQNRPPPGPAGGRHGKPGPWLGPMPRWRRSAPS